MSVECMKIEFYDAIKMAFMTKVPLVVVEGKDDLSVYTDLFKHEKRKFDVKPIQFFKDCSSGCHEIERNVDLINKTYASGHYIYKYFKGIVDRDAKAFRGEMIAKDGLFYLNCYSFENNFVTRNSIINSVKILTSLTVEQLNDELYDKIIENINQQFKDFYYIALEALRNAIEPDYVALIGFSDGYLTLLAREDKKLELMSKRPDLDAFALKHGVNCDCILNMKEFCKGKWHLRYFLQSVLDFTNALHAACGKELVICPICESGQFDSCMYKKTVNVNVSYLIKVIKSDINNADLEYLRGEIFNLAG